jgi:hypothetical protein
MYHCLFGVYKFRLVDLFENPKIYEFQTGSEKYAYRNIKRKLHKTIAAIWFNKTCRGQ